MAWMKKVYMSLLLLSVTFLAAGKVVSAEEVENEGYTYTVRVSAGKQGILSGNAADAVIVSRNVSGKTEFNPVSVKKEIIRDQLVISGLKYEADTIYFDPGNMADTKKIDPRYSVYGIRRSGRDRSKEYATGPVKGDADYVISYKIEGDLVPYEVHYLDAEGNKLRDSEEELFGNRGEEQIVSAKYIEGYLPHAYNMSKTLDADGSKNVFNFVYTPIEAEGNDAAEDGSTTTTTTTTGTGTGTAGTAGAGTGAAGADAGTGENTEADEDAAQVPDEEVPLDEGPQELENLDDEEVPLANMNQERPGKIMGYLPVYIGIGLVAAIALVATAIYLRKRRKVPAKEIVERIRNNEVK